MARRVKNVALDRAQEKAKKQKKIAIVLCAVLALILVYEVPHTLKMMHPAAKAPIVNGSATAAPAPNPTSTTPAVGGPPPASSQTQVASAPTQAILASVQPTADPGQLTEFARFASKDPFAETVQKTAGSTSSSSSSTPKAPKTPKLPKVPKAPPAPPPTSAVISVNGELMSVTVDTDFPTSGTVFSQSGAPLFHLLSLTEKTAKVTIAGGSYASGAQALTLTVGQPVTLQNTADGTRYTLLLEPQGTQVPTSTTPTSTTPAPTSTTPSVVPSTP